MQEGNIFHPQDLWEILYKKETFFIPMEATAQENTEQEKT